MVAEALAGWDVEIVETHHNRKVDAPSGTALMLADAAASARSQPSEYIYDRHSVRQPRGRDEIGISSVRGGTIVGEHEVIFAGRDEVIELRHSAQSREIFASGALRAARFLAAPASALDSTACRIWLPLSQSKKRAPAPRGRSSFQLSFSVPLLVGNGFPSPSMPLLSSLALVHSRTRE